MIVDAGLGWGSGVSAVEEILRTAPIAHMLVSGDPPQIQACRPGAVVVPRPFREVELFRAIEIALDGSAG